MSTIILDITEEATGEFDPLGTLLAIAIIVAFAYAAKTALSKGGLLWTGVAILSGAIAAIGVLAIVLNLLATL